MVLSCKFTDIPPLAGPAEADDNVCIVGTPKRAAHPDTFPEVVPDAIDRDSDEPVYAQLVRILRRQVADGVLRPGDQLPSEAQLCRRYGVSPMTVRRVINILADQGIVVGEQGRGTFIRPGDLANASFQLQRLQELVGGDEQATVRLLQYLADRQMSLSQVLDYLPRF